MTVHRRESFGAASRSGRPGGRRASPAPFRELDSFTSSTPTPTSPPRSAPRRAPQPRAARAARLSVVDSPPAAMPSDPDRLGRHSGRGADFWKARARVCARRRSGRKEWRRDSPFSSAPTKSGYSPKRPAADRSGSLSAHVGGRKSLRRREGGRRASRTCSRVGRIRPSGRPSSPRPPPDDAGAARAR